MTAEPGVYQLLLHLPEPRRIQVGKLGVFDFPAGFYIYTGSALGGLERRLARHRSRPAKLHWHIDYLLRHAQIERVDTYPTRERLECVLNRQVLARPDACVAVRGFGSSDCRCAAHLVYLGESEAGGKTGEDGEFYGGNLA